MCSYKTEVKKDIEKEFIGAYEANKNALFRHIMFRIGGDREKATDLLSDTFTRTWDALCKRNSENKEIENLRAYFYRVAHNLIVDEYGKPKIASLDALSEGREESDGDEKFDVIESGSHADVVKHSEVSELHRALAKLEQSDREILVMRYIDDIGPNEIAEIIGESANVISVRINRATKALREILNPGR
ncbi:MAG TPA: sigma-70 family RNA polymerase sigma factor [Candidatus Paceibacterota bacterium]